MDPTSTALVRPDASGNAPRGLSGLRIGEILLAHQAITREKDGKRHFEVIDAECVGCNLCTVVCPVENCITMEQVDSGRPSQTWEQRVSEPDLQRRQLLAELRRVLNAGPPAGRSRSRRDPAPAIRAARERRCRAR